MANYQVKNKYPSRAGKWMLVVDQSRIQHKDIFWIKYLYMMCHEWFIERNYGPRSDADWPETFYLHRFTQTAGQEVWIWWRFRKVFNRFIRYDLDIDWHVLGLEDKEIVKDNKKFKVNNGDIEIQIYAKLVFDPSNEFEKDSLLSSIRRTFYERIYYKDLIAHRKQLYNDVYEFKQALKTYFNMQKWLPEQEFHNFFLDENVDAPFFDGLDQKK